MTNLHTKARALFWGVPKKCGIGKRDTKSKKKREVCLGTHSLFRLGFQHSLGFRYRPFFFPLFLSPAAFYVKTTTTNDDDDIIIDRFETDASHIVPLGSSKFREEEEEEEEEGIRTHRFETLCSLANNTPLFLQSSVGERTPLTRRDARDGTIAATR